MQRQSKRQRGEQASEHELPATKRQRRVQPTRSSQSRSSDEAARIVAEEDRARRSAQLEAARLEAAQLEAARLEAAQLEAARLEAARREAARLEAVRREAVRREAARQEAARQEADQQVAAQQEAARRALQEVARQEAARHAQQDAAQEAHSEAHSEAHQEAPPQEHDFAAGMEGWRQGLLDVQQDNNQFRPYNDGRDRPIDQEVDAGIPRNPRRSGPPRVRTRVEAPPNVTEYAPLKTQWPKIREQWKIDNKFELDDPEVPGRWIRDIPVGQGGQAVVFAHVYVDENNNPVDTVVLKDCFVSTSAWERLSTWYGDPRKAAIPKPQDVAAMEFVQLADESSYCAQMRTWEMDETYRIYRILMDYCPLGTLRDIVHAHETAGKPIPEPALWAIMHGLTTACCVMASGSTSPASLRPHWPSEQIVHRDLKLNNVFVDMHPQGPSDFRSYPIPVVGDFGLAIFTSAQDALNPTAYQGPGTPSWKAPETVMLYDAVDGVRFNLGKLSEATNIWGIGAILIRMIDPEQAEFNYREGLSSLRIVDERRKRLYSEPLRSLAEWCCRWDPTRRPTLREVRSYVDRHTGDGQIDLAAGLRKGRIPHDDDTNVLWTARDHVHRQLAEILNE